MNLFEARPSKEPEVAQPEVIDKGIFYKLNLLKSVTRSDAVYKAIEDWLRSFTGAMSKDAFNHQLKRLDFDDNIALTQLSKAIGKRTIPLPPAPSYPSLPRPLIEQMLNDSYVAVYGKKFKPEIQQLTATLKSLGKTYVLSIEELIVEFKGFNEKGKGPQMVQNAIEADFLIIVDLEMPIHLEWHINEAIERIGRMREAKKLPIVSTWCRFNDCNRFFERFKIYKC